MKVVSVRKVAVYDIDPKMKPKKAMKKAGEKPKR